MTNVSYIHNQTPVICPEHPGLYEDTIAFFSKKEQGNVHKWLFSTPNFEADPVNGSKWWSALYEAPDYYLPKYETDVLSLFSKTIKKDLLLEKIFEKLNIVYDLGPGSEDCVRKKTFPFIQYINKQATYCPVDISAEFVESAAKAVKAYFPDFSIKPCLEDFENPTSYKSESALILFFGSTMFNVPAGLDTAFPMEGFLRQFKCMSHFIKDGYLIISQDVTHDYNALLKAYGSKEHIGMTKNFMPRINRDLNPTGNFDPEAWEYEPIWRKEHGQLAHGLSATKDQSFSIGDHRFYIKKGDVFVTHNSFKLPEELFIKIADKAGFKKLKSYRNERFATHLFKLSSF